MANRIQAINAYRPRVDLGKTVQGAELIRYLADRSGLNEGEVSLVMKELRDAVIFFNRAGRGIKLEGLGTYQPKVGLDGVFDIAHRVDSTIKNALNTPGIFSGTIQNRANIGKTADDLVSLWNTDHPDDPVT